MYVINGVVHNFIYLFNSHVYTYIVRISFSYVIKIRLKLLQKFPNRVHLKKITAFIAAFCLLIFKRLDKNSLEFIISKIRSKNLSTR